MRGFWKHYELWDGTYDVGDYFDIMEVIIVMDENERRQEKQAELERSLAK